MAERRGPWLLWLKILGTQIYWFCKCNVTTFPTSRKSKYFIFPLPTVPAETLYLQKHLTNSLKLFLAERRGRWLLWLKISTAQIFSFSNSNVTTFPTSRKCKYLIFAFHTVPAEVLYLQKYFTNFLKLFLAQRRGRSLFWLKISSAEKSSFFSSNVTTFPTSRKCKISIFPFTNSHLKCYISRSILRIF